MAKLHPEIRTLVFCLFMGIDELKTIIISRQFLQTLSKFLDW